MQPSFTHKTDFNSAAERIGRGIDAPVDALGRTTLHVAVKKDKLDSVERLLLLGANPHHPNRAGQPPIYEAIATQNIEMVKLLVKYGASFRIEDDQKRTPLMWAIEQKCEIPFLQQLRGLGLDLAAENKAGRQALHAAAAANRTDLIKYLAGNGVPVDSPDKESKTPLHLAVENKAHDALRALLAAGADAVIRTKEVKTPLYLAAAMGDEDAVDILLGQPSVRRSINEHRSLSEGYTPLMAAVAGNHTKVAESLIAVGADINQRDNQNRHSLFIAVELGRTAAMVEMLVRNGADVEKGIVDARGVPMLHKINQSSYNEVLGVLHAAGASLDIADASGVTALHKMAASPNELSKIRTLLELGANPNIQDNAGRRPLDAAMVMAGNSWMNIYDVVKLLVEFKADTGMSTNPAQSQSPLHLAAKSSNPAYITLLLSGKAKLEEADRTNGMTPWLIAVETRSWPAADALAQKGANVLAVDKNKKNALHIAAVNWSKDALEKMVLIPALVEHINAVDNAGLTPLHYACRMPRPESVDRLLRSGADPWIMDPQGLAALHHAAGNNNIALLNTFEERLGKKVDWNVRTRDEGETPLHIAAKKGHLAMISRLVALGGAISLKNKQGQTPLDLAVANKQEAATAMLMKITSDKRAASGPPSSRPPSPPAP